jgi:FAD/FMN-containing dehydrogenase
VATGWNKLYGKAGFTQYQFVLPFGAGPEGLRGIIRRIAESGMGSGLAVLKVAGKANDNPLSFPFSGYTLALDFKLQPGLFELLDELDAMLLGLGGRLYLTKDARMSEATFKQSYPRWQEFQAVREKVGAIGRFASLQSKRLGLD